MDKVPPDDPEVLHHVGLLDEKFGRPGEPTDPAAVAELLKLAGIPDYAELADLAPIPPSSPIKSKPVKLDEMKGGKFSGRRIREFLNESPVRESSADELGTKIGDALFFDVDVTCEGLSEVLAPASGHPHEVLGELETRLLRAHPKLPPQSIITFWHSTAVGEAVSFNVGSQFRTGIRERLAEYVRELEQSLPAAEPPAAARKRPSGRPATRPHREIARIVHKYGSGWKSSLNEICDELDDARVSISPNWKKPPTPVNNWSDMLLGNKDRHRLVQALEGSLEWERSHPGDSQ